MANTLEDTIKVAQKEYGLKVTDENKHKYKEFLKRQLNAHKDYDINFKYTRKSRSLPYFDLMVDKLLVFSYLIRQREVIENYADETKIILDSKEKLPLLKAMGTEISLWNDDDIYHIYKRREYGSRKWGLMKYREIIDELFKDPEIEKIWGKGLTYRKDVGIKKKKYNLYTR